MRRTIPAAVLLVVLAAFPSAAQDLYLVGGVGVTSRQPGSAVAPATPSPPPASSVAFITGGAGVWLPHGIGLEGSLSVTRAQSIAWHFGYQFAETGDNLTDDRDVPLLGLVRVAPLRHKAASVDAVAGGGVTFHRAATFATADCGPGSRPTACMPIEPRHLAEVFTTVEQMLTLGADIALRVSPRLAIAPGFRANFAKRPLYMTGFDHRGPRSGGGHLWAIGVTARYSFHG